MKRTKKPKSLGLKDLPKIKKLAQKKGTPLVNVEIGKKKSIHFAYRSGSGMIGFSYPSVLQGITKELRRLA